MATKEPDKTPSAAPATAGEMVILGDDWQPTGLTFPKPEAGYPFRFTDDHGVVYERAGAHSDQPAYRKVS